jgi:hypothetical protein
MTHPNKLIRSKLDPDTRSQLFAEIKILEDLTYEGYTAQSVLSAYRDLLSGQQNEDAFWIEGELVNCPRSDSDA